MNIELHGTEYKSPVQIILGRDLKLMRLKAKVTSSIAAEYLGIKSRKTIENWEADASSPNIKQFLLLCMYYDFDASKVVGLCLERFKNSNPLEDYQEIDFEACRTA